MVVDTDAAVGRYGSSYRAADTIIEPSKVSPKIKSHISRYILLLFLLFIDVPI